jgi:hypothetical protein
LFGAVGNGITNDYPAVQNAMASLSGGSGVRVFPSRKLPAEFNHTASRQRDIKRGFVAANNADF